MAEKKKSAPVSTGPVKPEDKKKALETALAQIEKNFGKGAIMRLGDDIPVNVEAISTGSLSLDLALGIGGVPRGRIVEIYGPESSGKTTLALHILASAQKKGGEVAFIDVEHALEPAYARALGVDIDSLLISQPDTGEQALEITEQLVRSGALDVVVVDSVAALLPRSELEGEMGESSVGVIARLMSQALRKLAGTVTSVLFKGVHYEMMIDAGDFTWKVHSTTMQPAGSRVGLAIVPFNIHIMHPMKEDVAP